MSGKRKKNASLTNSRIYIRRGKYALFWRYPIQDPRTLKMTKWHMLCPVSEGELRARTLAAAIIAHNTTAEHEGDLAGHVDRYVDELLTLREKDRPKEPARIKLFDEANKEIRRSFGVIKDGFTEFDVEQVIPVDVARFLKQWHGRRMAQVYLSRLTGFFAWACTEGIRADNPCREVSVKKPPKVKTYITHEQWHAVRDALLIGKDKVPTLSGPMVQCYVDLCYLLYQRTTEIRLLKWSQVDLKAGFIYFRPTKTERSSGASVAVPITPAVRVVLERSRKALAEGKVARTKKEPRLGTVQSIYVIHTRQGQPYQTRSLADAWERACERAKVEGITLKDIRAKAATDAKRAGFTRAQLRVALAHTDEAMTEHYLRGLDAEASDVVLDLPPAPSGE